MTASAYRKREKGREREEKGSEEREREEREKRERRERARESRQSERDGERERLRDSVYLFVCFACEK